MTLRRAWVSALLLLSSSLALAQPLPRRVVAYTHYLAHDYFDVLVVDGHRLETI